ncbi:MAG: protein kinase [Thermoanaerobaculia bacterium]
MSGEKPADEIPDLFARALELADDDRRQFLAELGRRDPALAAALVRLLEHTDDPDSPLDRSPWEEFAEAAAPIPAIPEKIGPYRIERELGSGGMGRVFLAVEETADFSRQLALKIIDRPLADGDSIRRFREELRILSLLEHPGIARFLHGGCSPEGVWYLALEYVDGVDLLTWSSEHQLDRERRVRLFLAVLEPVRYAHGRGVVHRDLKPGHLLIDRTGRPRLLDFGISKLLDPDAGEDVTMTRTDARQLTPAYASPEQFRGEPISPATDVFALGVVLYELLSGRRPFAPATRSAAAYEQAVLHSEPIPPSAGLAPGAALGRDLDAICLKALRKPPAERYHDADDLAADLARYLDGRAVAARRGGLQRAVVRGLRRHRHLFAAASVLLVLFAGLAWRSLLPRRAALFAGVLAEPPPRSFPFADIAAKDIAELERAFATEPASLRTGALLALALDQKRRLPEAKLIAARLRQLPAAAEDPLLAYVDATLAMSSDEPQNALVLFTRARDRAVAQGRGELIGQIRAARGRLLSTLGERDEAYREMDLARDDFERAGDAESLGRVLNDLAIEHLIRGELAQGQDLLERAISAARQADAPATIMLHNLGQLATFRGDPAQGESYLREVVAVRRREGNAFRIGEVLAAYSEALDDLGRRHEAIASLDEAAAILRQADDKSALVSTLYLRGTIAVSAGELDRVALIAAELEACGTQTGGYLGLISAYALRGFAAGARGDSAAMRREFGAAEQLAIAKGHLDFAAGTEAAHAAAELRAGDRAAADSLARRALGRLPAGSATSAPLAIAQAVLAQVDAAALRLDDARTRLASFGEDADRSTSVSRRLALLAARAAVERASGRPEAATETFAQAIELARRAGRKFEERDFRRRSGTVGST